MGKGVIVVGSSTFPVDAVYLWVDGSDPKWIRKKENAIRKIKAKGEPYPDAAHRFQDNNELKYSLRSLEKCMPWIRNVYLITDDQCPPWIKKDKVIIIDQKNIFPGDDHFQTFNSHAIELCQHRLNGLAECFLSINDDFILGKNIRKQDVFTRKGHPVIWAVKMSERHKASLLSDRYDQMTPHRAGETRARCMILERYGLYLPYRIRHYPKPMTRTGMQAIWEQFPIEVNRTISSQLRSTSDVAIHALFSFYSIAVGKGRLRVINGARQIGDALVGRLRYMGATIGDKNFDKKLKYIKRLKPLTFCFNDGNRAAEAHRQAVMDFFKTLYPQPSKYEK